jgi:rhodanese-related sulfurtransferase
MMAASPITVVDLRDASDFVVSHLPNSINVDVGARNKPNPFFHPQTLIELFNALEERLPSLPVGSQVLTLSYDGHLGRLASSILRHRGMKAFCAMGGSKRWEELNIWANACEDVADESSRGCVIA